MRGKLTRRYAKGKVKIEGECPNCGVSSKVGFADLYYKGESKPFAINMPICSNCHYDEIRLRKINNRRYKVHDIQWDEYYENLSEYRDYSGEDDCTF